MARHKKRKLSADEVVEECTRRESDFSADDSSDAESYVSDVDSVLEEMFLEGRDIVYDTQTVSDPEWKPTKTDDCADEQTTDLDSEPEPVPSSSAKVPRMKTRRGRGRATTRGRARGRGSGPSARQTEAPLATAERWYGVDHPDIKPTQPVFRPSRKPGCQLVTTANYIVLQLFQLFFTNSLLLNLVKNTNEHGRATQNTVHKPWTDITLQDMLTFLSIVIYMGFMKATALTDYWRKGPLYSLGFPKSIISGRKFLSISSALHLSSAKGDNENEEKRGTTEHDRLGKIKPLYLEIRNACRSNYQPDQHISIDERMVASKARVHFKQYIKNKPVRWGFKLFVLADSKSGYTWDFFVYEGKNMESSGKGMGYDSVMKLLDTSSLGTGYKLYVDNFYTSPTLFRDLLQKKIWACGTLRSHGCPRTTINALDNKSSRGSIRWIREGSLLFVQWRDTRDVSLLSTIHTAHGEEAVKRKMRDAQGCWTTKDVPVPPVVKDYNMHMGGVDLSDAMIGYYNVLHKTRKWYKTFFDHFLDIAIVNAFVIHKDICKAKGQVPMHQKGFRETLSLELAQAGARQSTPQEAGRGGHHRLAYISSNRDRVSGRLKCRKCHAKTAVKCPTCDVPLCFIPDRDCYNAWHEDHQ